MAPDFWLERWQRGEIGFHLPRPHLKLLRHWRSAASGGGEPVLVPLCGKSLDMGWLASQGHGICGVELSAVALEDFVAEAGLSLDRRGSDYTGVGWHLHCGDWFDFSTAEPFSLFYDRAALIALPPALRERYVAHLLDQLTNDARGLLITLEYDRRQMDGPPFSVDADEVRRLFGDRARVSELERADIISREPRFRERGLACLEEVVWLVECHG
ncbi:MAG: thiopurine S-methyltransferase [Alcanivoracaceae bacterium]|nr:thiopurine S-methyltransferase [Alcanivoracaceae bacterium]